VSLRWRIALGFALVALATAAVVALAIPPIVDQGFAEFDNDNDNGPVASAVATSNPAATPGPSVAPAANESGDDGTTDDGGQAAAPTAAAAPLVTRGQAQQSTSLRLILVAIAAAAVASLLGLFGAGRLVRPLNRLEEAAASVAKGDLRQRSGLAERRDEFGQLGRTFDSMADELERAEESRRGFLQDAVHELKTPLAVIDATSSAILDGVYTPERRHIETMRDQSRVLARIVDDLRTISLAEGGHLPLERRAVDLPAALASVAAGFEARAAGQGATMSVDAPAGLAVDADPDRVRQMATALVDNALRHTPGGGRVRMVAAPIATQGRSPARRTVRIAVEDTGTGIPPAALPRVFERFFQADPAHSRATGTSGLGLSIVKALAEAQGGRVGAENIPDGGARLWFELPMAAAGQAAGTSQASGPVGASQNGPAQNGAGQIGEPEPDPARKSPSGRSARP
jgi:two-component system, OmpR family, sensor histidine kinase BaeS